MMAEARGVYHFDNEYRRTLLRRLAAAVGEEYLTFAQFCAREGIKPASLRKWVNAETRRINALKRAVGYRREAMADRVAERLVQIVDADATLVLSEGDVRKLPEGVRQSIASIERGDDGRLRVKMVDKISALTLLAKHLSMLPSGRTEQKVESLLDLLEQARSKAAGRLSVDMERARAVELVDRTPVGSHGS